MKRHNTKQDNQIANKDMKRCSISYAIREMSIKTIAIMTHVLEMAKIENTDNTKCW